MTKMLEFLRQILGGQNQFASGGLVLMIIGGISVYLRALPVKLWFWIIEQTTMMITVKDDDAAFDWVKEWFLEQKFLQRIRRVDLDTTLRGKGTALIPAPGRHRFWYGGRPFWVWFSRSEETKGWTPRRIESLTFRTIGRQQAFLKQFVDEIVACHENKQKASSYLYVYDEGWTYVKAYSPRSLDSVILKPGERERLIEDVETFRASRQRYRHLGVPYHRGYLLYGPPGTGKTSLVSGLAAKFGMSLYAVNLTEFNDRTLKSAINDVPQHAVILFEDIDCMKSGNRRTEQSERDRASPGGPGEGRSGRSLRRQLIGVAECVGWFSCSGKRSVCDDHQPCGIARPGAAASGTHRLQVVFGKGCGGSRRSNCIAGSFPRRLNSKPANLWRLTSSRKRWRSSKACCWDWNGSPTIWNGCLQRESRNPRVTAQQLEIQTAVIKSCIRKEVAMPVVVFCSSNSSSK